MKPSLLALCLLLASCGSSSKGFSVIHVCQKDSYSKTEYCQICLKDELKNKCYPFGTSDDGLLFAIDLTLSKKESIEDGHYVFAKGVEIK